MDENEIGKIYKDYWQPGWRSISRAEVQCFQELIRRHRPRHFLEVGTASGLSGGIICRLLEENGGREFTTLDRNRRFFADRTKELGYLIEEIYTGTAVTVHRRLKTTALDLPELDVEIDMAFVDGNHSHPYPTLDTLCIYPFLSGARIVLHHDLERYKHPDGLAGIGGRYLFDQVPHDRRGRCEANNGNLGWLDLSMPKEEFESIAVDALLMPWSNMNPMPPEDVQRISGILRRYYSDPVADAFDQAAARDKRPVGSRARSAPDAGPEARSPEPTSRASALRRLLRR